MTNEFIEKLKPDIYNKHASCLFIALTSVYNLALLIHVAHTTIGGRKFGIPSALP